MTVRSRMDINQRKEQFSHAYVRAVASAAGYTVSRPEVDDDSLDLSIKARGGSGKRRSPQLDIQLKSTARDVLSEHHLRFPLNKKNYDELRPTNMHIPRILIVVIIPDDISEWLFQDQENHLLLRHCGYWYSLRGLPDSGNTTSVTLSIPRKQKFTVEALDSLMAMIGQGEVP